MPNTVTNEPDMTQPTTPFAAEFGVEHPLAPLRMVKRQPATIRLVEPAPPIQKADVIAALTVTSQDRRHAVMDVSLIVDRCGPELVYSLIRYVQIHGAKDVRLWVKNIAQITGGGQ